MADNADRCGQYGLSRLSTHAEADAEAEVVINKYINKHIPVIPVKEV